MTRQARVEELIRQEVAKILREEVNDPRIGFVSITSVKISPDLENASIFISIYGDEKAKEGAMAGLHSATRFVRGVLGDRLELRQVPQIRFVRDDSIERGSNVLSLMNKLSHEERTGKIRNELKQARTALIAVHVDPDGDAIGSMLALGMVLESRGITTELYCADPVPKIYRFLPGADKIKQTINCQQSTDLALVIDSSDISRTGGKYDLRRCARVIINIDHHPDNTLFGDINYVSRCSSVAELVFDLARFLKVKFDKRIADCIYAAMITDTGNFRYENTNVKTFLIAAELLKAGVNTHDITTKIYDTKTIPSVKISSLALANLQLSPDHKVGWAIVTEKMMAETGAKGEDLIGIVDRIRSIEGVEVAVFFREEKGKVKINFRAKDKVNVSEIAKRFGGGGHIKAAGAAVEGEIGLVVERVITELLKYLKAASFLV